MVAQSEIFFFEMVQTWLSLRNKKCEEENMMMNGASLYHNLQIGLDKLEGF